MEGAKRILVIDDDTFLRMLVSIELPDCELLEADRAEEAYELAKAEQPDAILIDVRLPDGDGIDLLRRLRRTGSLATTPILIITAGHDEAQRTEIMRAGADEYLPKPIEGTQLVERLERLLSIEPTERRLRRRDLIDKLVAGATGDPDPPPDHTENKEDPRRGRLRRRHRGD
jgi:DNA-binding response OmpR family regulator